MMNGDVPVSTLFSSCWRWVHLNLFILTHQKEKNDVDNPLALCFIEYWNLDFADSFSSMFSCGSEDDFKLVLVTGRSKWHNLGSHPNG